jgi:hypothetical protein
MEEAVEVPRVGGTGEPAVMNVASVEVPVPALFVAKAWKW